VARYGLDQPLPVQYGVWLRQGCCRAIWATPSSCASPVAELIAESLPHSLLLGGLAFVFSAVVGVLAGAVAAAIATAALDRGVMAFILLGSTLPSFWLGLLLMLVFAVQLEWLPVSGARSWSALVLPVLTIGLHGVALVARVTRAAMLDVGRRDFVLDAARQGLVAQADPVAACAAPCAAAGGDDPEPAHRLDRGRRGDDRVCVRTPWPGFTAHHVASTSVTIPWCRAAC
jgi:ABC-type dipeptide/oligopeptide/nickel transport system permease component